MNSFEIDRTSLDRANSYLVWAEQGLQQLQTSCPQGADWVLTWVGTLSLLRSIGHIMENVSKGIVKEVNQELFREVNSDRETHKVFHEFVREYRNIVLKEGDLMAGQGIGLFTPRITITYPLRVGAYEGRDQTEILSEAIDWWKWYLDEVELRVGARRLECQVEE